MQFRIWLGGEGGEIILKDTLLYSPRPLFRIRIGFNAVSDLDFYLNVDPDPGSQTNADPNSEPGQFCRHKKLDFDMKNILYCCTVGNMSYNKPVRVKRHFEKLKGTVSRDFSLLVFFINQFPPSPRVSH
jgi:hypothetical protein